MKRVENIDIVRGFAMIAVVLGHVFYYNGYKNTLFCTSLYSWHMSVFMFIAGFCAQYKDVVFDKYVIIKFLKTKVITLLVPYIVWCIISLPFHYSIGELNSAIGASQYLILFNEDYWFFPCLFILFVCYALFRYIYDFFSSKSQWIVWGLILFIIMLIAIAYLFTSNTYTKRCLTYAVPFFSGVYFATNKSGLELVLSKKVLLIICIFLFLMFNYIYYFFSGEGFVVFPAKLVCGLSVIYISLYIVNHVKFCNTMNEQLRCIGTHTSGIYVIHLLMVRNILSLNNYNVCISLLLSIVLSVVLIYGSLFITNVFGKNKILNVILFGKNTNNVHKQL